MVNTGFHFLGFNLNRFYCILCSKLFFFRVWYLDRFLCINVPSNYICWEIFRLITGFVARLTRRVTLVEQELLTLPEHLSSPPVFSGVRFTRSLVLCVCFVDRCLSFCPFTFGHCVVCPSLIYGFWLPLWYLQALLVKVCCKITILVLFKKDLRLKQPLWCF